MFNVYLFLDGVIMVGLGLLVAFVLSNQGYRKSINRLFALFAILVGIWIITNHIGGDISASKPVVLIADYLVFACSFGAMILIMKIFAYIASDKGAIKLSSRIEPVLWIVFVLSATPLMVADVERQDQTWAVIFGPFTPIWAAFLILSIAVTYYAIRQGYKTLRGAALTRLKTLTIALSVTLPLTISIAFILPVVTGLFWMTEFGVVPLLALIIGLYYSVVRQGLFDVRLTAIRTVVYALSIAVLILLYFVLAYLASIIFLNDNTPDATRTSPFNVTLALILALSFQPVKRYFDKVTNHIFFRDQYNSEDFYARLSEVLTYTTDMRGLLQRAAKEIGATLKAEQTFFYVQYNHSHHVSAGTKGHSLIPLQDGKSLNEYVKSAGNAVIVTELLQDDDPIRKLLVSHKIAVLMPIVKHGSTPSYLALGDNQGSGYTDRDIKVLHTISDELLIAIQNALSVQMVKDINEHLEQRIKTATAELKRSNAHLRRLDATKDEFVSMASHQLRTPLTSIKGYLSMILEGDVGKVSPAQRKVLSEAFDSSERMVRLIHDFLNVSRLQTGKFSIEYTSYDIVKLIKQEIDTLQSTAEKRNITIAADMDVGMLDITLDETKMRQVIMNFIDNALYYSQEGTTVHVELKKVLDVLVFRVTDTGIGVPESEREHLFTKFYRASNARLHRPDGTGVGLYLAKKVITAHGGGVLYEPHPDGGSTFGFTLPLPK